MPQRRCATDPANRSDRGTALLLYPTCVLVLLILAGIAVDLSLVREAKQELTSLARSAADDAAAALDPLAVRDGRRLEIDPVRAEAIVAATLDDADLPGSAEISWTVSLGDEPGTVIVDASAVIDLVFTPNFPGLPADQTVRARAGGRRLQI